MELMVAVIATVCMIVLVAWGWSLYVEESPRWWSLLEVLMWLAVLVPLFLWVAVGIFVSVPTYEWSFWVGQTRTACDEMTAVNLVRSVT